MLFNLRYKSIIYTYESIPCMCTKHSLNTTFFLHFSAYQVIVLKVTDGVEELPNDYDSKLKDNANIDFYIAAEIGNNPVHEKSWKFYVGDDKKYGAYVNKRLERGADYVVYQRAVTYDKDVSKRGLVTIGDSAVMKVAHKFNCTYRHVPAGIIK